MIVKTPQGHQVQSEAGKPLSKPNLSREAAKDRLAQVERFKNISKWGKKYARTRDRA
jgi:hypothetical protein